MASAVQRVGVGAELPALLSELGADVAACFAGTGVDPAALRVEDRLPFATLLGLLDQSARVAGCPHLGLLLGLRFRFAHHGLIGQLMQAAPTLGRALSDFVAWQPGYSSGAVVYLIRPGGELVLGYGSLAADAPGSRVLYDTAMGVGLRMVDGLTRGRVQPLEVHLSYRLPGNAAVYPRHLRAPVRFAQPRSCLVYGAGAKDARLPGADAERWRQLEAEAMALARARDPGIAARVRHALRPLVQDGHAGMPAVAAALGLHPRTLRRRLAEEGGRFADLRDAVRYALAREFLAMTDLPVGEVAAAVGFGAPGVFSESFRRWSGTTPSEWRKAQGISARD